MRAQLTALGLNVGYMPPAQLAERERAYTARWVRAAALIGTLVEE